MASSRRSFCAVIMAATSSFCACGPQSALFRVSAMVRLQSATVEEPGEKNNARCRCRPRTFCLNGSAVASVAAFGNSSLVMLVKVEHRSRIAQEPLQFRRTHHLIRHGAVQSYAVGQEPVCNNNTYGARLYPKHHNSPATESLRKSCRISQATCHWD